MKQIRKLFDSLQIRLLATASIVLVVFLGLTGMILDTAYEQSAKVSQFARLEANIHDLLRIADPESSGALVIPGDATDRRLMQPESGLYAQVTTRNGRVIWSSPSMIGTRIHFQNGYTPAQQSFYEVDTKDGHALFAMSLGVAWIDNHGRDIAYTFSVAERQTFFWAQVHEFQRSLWFWLGGLVVVLLFVQWGILRWSVMPIRALARDVRAIEQGKKPCLNEYYIYELEGLTRNVNALISQERKRQERYSNATADLAHSLKTPLAVIRNILNENSSLEDNRSILAEQVERLDQITQYQLQRAATSGKATFHKAITVASCFDPILNALLKVYHDKQVKLTQHCSSDAKFYGEKGDLMEILGNLFDNAFKYCRQTVHVEAEMCKKDNKEGLLITIQDDGEGIHHDAVNQVLQRGVRMDSKTEGQGIGLAVTNEIVKAYEGEIKLFSPKSGGTQLQVFFPR